MDILIVPRLFPTFAYENRAPSLVHKKAGRLERMVKRLAYLQGSVLTAIGDYLRLAYSWKFSLIISSRVSGIRTYDHSLSL